MFIYNMIATMKDAILLAFPFIIIPLIIVLIDYFDGMLGDQYTELALVILIIALLITIYKIR
jgi:hypothetical protein